MRSRARPVRDAAARQFTAGGAAPRRDPLRDPPEAGDEAPCWPAFRTGTPLIPRTAGAARTTSPAGRFPSLASSPGSRGQAPLPLPERGGAAWHAEGEAWAPPFGEPHVFSGALSLSQDSWRPRWSGKDPPARGGCAAALEDENRSLREEIGRMQSATLDSFHRRPLAGMAGGGFRGPRKVTGKCMCEELQAKLAKTQALLIESRRRPSKELPAVAREQSDPPLPPDPLPPPAGAATAAEELVARRAPEAAETREAAVQASVQLEPGHRSDASLQVGASFRGSADASAQTDQPPGPAAAVAAASQTDAPAPPARGSDAFAQTVAPPAQRSDAYAQTTTAPRSTAASQTGTPPSAVSAGVQVAPRTAAAEAQTHPFEDSAAWQEAQARVREAHAAAAKLGRQIAVLEEGVQVWREKATSKLLAQVNITVLCPRAECTINGESTVIDGWNPALLKRELERDVLPRFTRVFVDETSLEDASDPFGACGPRAAAAKRASAEFAEAFRARLSVILSAPNAEQAVAGRGAG